METRWITSNSKKMNEMYSLSTCSNVEIQFKWIRLGIKSKWLPIVEEALQLVNKQGRMKFVRPIYRDLYSWEEKRQEAIDNYQAKKSEMMFVLSEGVAKDLHLV